MNALTSSRMLWLTAFLRRSALLAILWWILTEGRVDALLPAAVLILAAAATSFALQPPVRLRWHPLHLPRVVVYFAWQSLRGGWDVARRALALSLPVQPALVEFELRLRPGFPTVLFGWLVNLTPGTALVAIRDTSLVVHALDVRLPIEAQLRNLERHVAALFDGA